MEPSQSPPMEIKEEPDYLQFVPEMDYAPQQVFFSSPQHSMAACVAYYGPPVYLEIPPPLPGPPTPAAFTPAAIAPATLTPAAIAPAVAAPAAVRPAAVAPEVVPCMALAAVTPEPTRISPVQGRIPFRYPAPPATKEEASLIGKSMLPGSTPRRNVLLEQSSHCDLVYYEDLERTTWRCLDCYQEMAPDWQFRYLHVTGLTSSLQTPRCPGSCRMNPFRVARASRCRQCTFIIRQHEEEVRHGEVFLSCPIR